MITVYHEKPVSVIVLITVSNHIDDSKIKNSSFPVLGKLVYVHLFSMAVVFQDGYKPGGFQFLQFFRTVLL